MAAWKRRSPQWTRPLRWPVVASLLMIGAWQHNGDHILASPVQDQRPMPSWQTQADGSRVDHLPAGDTYASLQLVRLLPDAELAEPPIDGPRLVSVISGAVDLRTELSGAAAFGADGTAGHPVAIPPRVAYLLQAGETALIPAGVPILVANKSSADAEWIQAQLETPSTVCPCGADLSGVQRVLLASKTLQEPLPPGSFVALSTNRLETAEAFQLPGDASLRLVASVAGTGMERHDDEAVANTGTALIEFVVFTVVPDDVLLP